MGIEIVGLFSVRLKSASESVFVTGRNILYCFHHVHFDMHASNGRHVNQGIQTEQTDFSAHEVRHTVA